MTKTAKITQAAIMSTQQDVEKAEEALRQAKFAHLHAFRVALAQLCNEYRFRIESCDGLGLRELGGSEVVSVEEMPL